MDTKETGKKRVILILFLTLLLVTGQKSTFENHWHIYRIKANKNKRQYHLKMTETLFCFINYDSEITKQQ